MKIAGIQKITLIDYPGVFACTLFTIGCNLRCFYCHNPELLYPEKYNTKTLCEDYVLDFLAERKDFLDGVCVSGGEPTMQKDLPGFLYKIKQFGYKIKLDTNGTNPKMITILLKYKLIDFIAMDIKAKFEDYKKITLCKVNIDNIKESIYIIEQSGIDYQFRTTVLDDFHSDNDIEEMRLYLSCKNELCLQKYVDRCKEKELVI